MKVLSISFIIIGVLGFIFLGVMHEEVHKRIHNSYDIEIEISYLNSDLGFNYKSEAPCPTPECKLANNINDVVVYAALPFYILIFTGLLFEML